MHATGEYSISDLAELFSVSRPTVYRTLNRRLSPWRTILPPTGIDPQLHTLQLLPGPDRPSYAGTVVEVLVALDGRLSVRREGRIIPAREASPPPVFLRNGGGSYANSPVPHPSPGTLAEGWGETLAPLDTMADNAKESGSAVEGAASADKSPLKPARKPTFLQKARWKAVEKARRKGMSLRAIERELGIHRSTIKKYLDAEGPPTRRSPAVPPAPSDTAPADTMKT